MNISKLKLKDINSYKYLIVGTNASVYQAKTKSEAETMVKNIISDIVYEELGGDFEFLYDENGEILPDEQIVDNVDEILTLGEEEYICYIDSNGLWAYTGGEDGHGHLRFLIYEVN